MSTPDVLRVHDLAAKLNRTEGAIRAAVTRDDGSVPPMLAQVTKGKRRRLEWSRQAVDQWLADRAANATKGGVS
jgi:hypothetical protein